MSFQEDDRRSRYTSGRSPDRDASAGESAAETDPTVRTVPVVRLVHGVGRSEEQAVICEAPVTLMVNGREVVTLLAVPSEPDVLAIGFLFSEGWIRRREEIVDLHVEEETGVVRIELVELPSVADRFWEKRLLGSGCGKAVSFYSVMDAMQCRPVSSPFRVSMPSLLAWMKETLQGAPLYGRTRGTHAVALYGEAGRLFLEQDIGRHNALDRIAGKCFLQGLAVEDTVLFMTGRLSSEMIVKAARLGVPILVSRSSTTTLAIDLAERLNMTVLGRLRAGGLTLYTHPHRVQMGQ